MDDLFSFLVSGSVLALMTHLLFENIWLSMAAFVVGVAIAAWYVLEHG